jgi:two-component system sensor kinase FixL
MARKPTYEELEERIRDLEEESVKAKREEEALQDSEKRYRRLFESAKDGILILDADTGKVVDVNPFLTGLLGYSYEALCGKRIWEIGPFTDIAASKEAFRTLQDRQYIRYEDLPLKTSDGQLVDVEFVSNVYQVDHSKVIQCNIRDITERKRAEEAWRESEQRFRRLFEDDLTGDCITTGEGIILECNPAFLRMFGYKTKVEAVGESITVLSPEPSERGSILDKLRATGKLENYETIRKRKDGRLIAVTENIVATFDEGGKLIEVKAYIYDITDRKRAEEALQKAHDELELRVRERTAELERRNKELQEFVFIASHDLQEPLRKIRTFGDLLARKSGGSLGDDRRDCLNRMQNAAKRMQELIDSLSAYSRVATKAEPLKKTALNNVVEVALSNLEIVIRDKGAQVDVDQLPTVEADGDQMIQLFQNLIGNALKFQPPNASPHVKVYAHLMEKGGLGKDDAHEIFVEDNGIGFDEKYLDKLFVPFQRLHEKTKYDGVGMGLAICKKIVDRQGGNITARSCPGKGSTFIIRLPIRQNDR